MKRILFLGAILLFPCCALGRESFPVYDFELVECELVVVARIEPETFERFRGDKADVKLIVAETLKGIAPGKIFDVRVNGLLIVGGYYKGKGRAVDLRGGRKDYPKTKIVLYAGGWPHTGGPDLSRNAIWFLRKNKGEAGYVLKASGYAQPATLKPYLIALLSGGREKILAMLKHKDEAIRTRVLRHLSGFHRPRDVKYVLPLLGDKSVAVQSLAAQTLAQMADASAVGHFRKALGHKNQDVRTVAAIFLSRFRDVQSIPAIAKAAADLGLYQQPPVLANLGRMGSRQAVPVLLEFLDEHTSPGKSPHPQSYRSSKAAAASLHELTGVWFPLDTSKARERWERLKAFPEDVLIRKNILAEIENLTDLDFETRGQAYRRLGKLVNRHFGSYYAYHNVEKSALRSKSRALWRRWAGENLTRSRLAWIRDGFKASGIRLPSPMDNKGIDTLIEVLAYYAYWSKQRTARRPWKWTTTGGWRKADMHRYNANLLLERYTGHIVGLSPYHRDMVILPGQDRAVLANRWADWWRKHRGRIKLKPWPAVRRVTAEMLSKVPDILPAPAPIRVTIRTSKAAFPLLGPVVVHVQVTNVSSRAITIAKRPRGLTYKYTTGTGSSGGAGHLAGSGHNKEDFVTLKPGRSLEWTETKAAFTHRTEPTSYRGFYYRLMYSLAGTSFGLRAWRGEVSSNRITYALTN